MSNAHSLQDPCKLLFSMHPDIAQGLRRERAHKGRQSHKARKDLPWQLGRPDRKEMSFSATDITDGGFEGLETAHPGTNTCVLSERAAVHKHMNRTKPTSACCSGRAVLRWRALHAKPPSQAGPSRHAWTLKMAEPYKCSSEPPVAPQPLKVGL